jgi:hypothetical protein
MTAPAAGRGGIPPRPAGPTPATRPRQWFVFGAWLYDIQAAQQALRDAPRPDRLLPVAVWAGAYGLDREPGASPHTIALIGPGPGFDPGYAMRPTCPSRSSWPPSRSRASQTPPC